MCGTSPTPYDAVLTRGAVMLGLKLTADFCTLDTKLTDALVHASVKRHPLALNEHKRTDLLEGLRDAENESLVARLRDVRQRIVDLPTKRGPGPPASCPLVSVTEITASLDAGVLLSGGTA